MSESNQSVLELRVAALTKTVEILTNEALRRQSEVAELRLLEKNAQLQRVVELRTAELERRGAELQESNRQMMLTHQEQLQRQKLESIGRLAAGIAHEINTPIQFVSDSIFFVSGAIDDMSTAVRTMQDLVKASGSKESSEALSRVKVLLEEGDLEYFMEEAPLAISRCNEGLHRVAEIVRSVKEFAHQGREEAQLEDLNRAIRGTLMVAQSEYRMVADVTTELELVDPVHCSIGPINQALLNLVVNAAHAISDKRKDTFWRGSIGVRTWQTADDAFISVADNGDGIPSHVLTSIFEPFFTTKEVGRGTGQGLAIARSAIQRQGGDLTVTTELGVGSEFTIRLPLRGAVAQEEVA